ncbi:MAG: ATP-dependent Clp protease adaptor ClpS [Phycisphaerales bacterium]|jgi:ATP-dependent Clp protease adapter protein ClpS
MSDSGTATAPTPVRTRPTPKRLPPWKVLLHNDRRNYMEYVVAVVSETVRLPRLEAQQRMLEAHRKGVAVLVTTHREHAELLVEQLRSRRLVVTAEPDEA